MNLSNLIKAKTTKTSKRVGRGYSSGKGGHTSGRGQKGQKSRKGAKPWAGFEGGQVPLFKKLPMIGGFSRHYILKPSTVNTAIFNDVKEGTEVTPELLVEMGVLKKLPKSGVKILSGDSFKGKITFKGFMFSKKAREEIEKAGSKIIE